MSNKIAIMQKITLSFDKDIVEAAQAVTDACDELAAAAPTITSVLDNAVTMRAIMGSGVDFVVVRGLGYGRFVDAAIEQFEKDAGKST